MPGLVDQAAAIEQLAAQQMAPDFARDFLLPGGGGDRFADLMLGLLVAVDRAGVVVRAGVAEDQAFLEFGDDVGLEPERHDGVLIGRKIPCD